MGLAPGGSAANARLMVEQGSWSFVDEGLVEFVDCAVVDTIALSSAAATMKSMSAWFMTSSISRSG
jgi:hypothetical protein